MILKKLPNLSKKGPSKKSGDVVINDKPYVSTTGNIEISVWPEFVDGKNSVIGEIYIWAYHVRIQNNNSQSVKLLNRYWRIIDEKGNVSEVSGEGVIGEQPTIAANTSYQYSSGVHLRYPSGIMTGKYEMKMLNDESSFEVAIPKFSLDSPLDHPALN